MRSLAAVALVAALCAGLASRVADAAQVYRVGGCRDEDSACILPYHMSEFLPGVRFDIRIEHHALAGSPEPVVFDIAIQPPGASKAVPLSTFLERNATIDEWSFVANTGDLLNVVPTTYTAFVRTWRTVALPRAGDYTVIANVDGVTTTALWTVRKPKLPRRKAKNVILMIADGSTLNTMTAARYLSRGMTNGKINRNGKAGPWTFDEMDYLGHLHTSGADSIITDSANSAAAYNTGHKSSVSSLNVFGDSSPDPFDDPKQETFAELLRRTTKKSIGVVTTADLQDATPAAVFSHTRQRGEKVDISKQLFKGTTFPDFGSGVAPEVVLGGGGSNFQASGAPDWFEFAHASGYTVVTNRTQMLSAEAAKADKLFGVFHAGVMNVWVDRNMYKNNLNKTANSPIKNGPAPTDQPGLVDMTKAALSILSRNRDGFFLMVEAASVDKQLHSLDSFRSLADLIEFERTAAFIKQWAEDNGDETLIIATSDHGHGWDVYGTVDTKVLSSVTNPDAKRQLVGVYEDAGHLDVVDADGDGYPDSLETRFAFAAGAVDFPTHLESFQVTKAPRSASVANSNKVPVTENNVTYVPGRLPTTTDEHHTGILYNANLPDSTGGADVHSFTDVPVWTHGPGAEALKNTHENVEVFFAMVNAVGILHHETEDAPAAPTGPAAEPKEHTAVHTVHTKEHVSMSAVHLTRRELAEQPSSAAPAAAPAAALSGAAAMVALLALLA